MTLEEKISYIEEALDVEKGTLSEGTVLETLEEWGSIAILSLIAMFDSEFNREIAVQKVRGFKTVKDILDALDE